MACQGKDWRRRPIVFEPDALVVLDPIIVVEVASPSTQRADALVKFARYFRNPHVLHYLIVVPDVRIVIHHRRTPAGHIETASVETGSITFDQPPIVLPVDALFPTA